MHQTNYFIEGLITKDEDIILKIYKVIFPKVLRFVVNNNGQQTDAEDIFQNALLQISVRYNKQAFEIRTNFNAYLFTVCKNLWRRELNKSKNWVTNDNIAKLQSKEEDLSLATLEQERWELFTESLNQISDNCKKILKLYFNKTPYTEIVIKMGYNSEMVVRQRVFKCKTKLTSLIKKDKRYKSLIEL
ncbi:MAG: sigma-70 family RNA polymerase sigma factor [Flavobacteriaceae bacterium]